MSDVENCRVCGEERPGDAPAGLCPACLLKAGLMAKDSKLEEVTYLFGPASSSIVATLSEAFGKIPAVLLRDADSVNDSGPVIRPTSDEVPLPAERTDRLQLFGEIARGGMGAVLKGRDADLGRELAVKVLLESHKDKPDMVRRFIEEAQIAGQLQHPGIVPVYELGAFGDQRPYFAMKLVKGHTLAETLANRKSLSEGLPRLLTIFESICQTMAYAHARGVVHRDLKPSNVMVGSFGEVQVMDWGLAKVLPRGGVVDDASAGHTKDQATLISTARSGTDADLSQAGSVMGTPAYMAPEQARGEVEELDERADVFALGSIFCELLTGQPAFNGRNSGEILRKAARGDLAEAVTRLDRSDLGHDPELIALAKSCLSSERDDRPRHAGEVAERISLYHSRVQERLRQSEIERAEQKARAEEATKRVTVERHRQRLTVALAASIIGFTILGGGGWVYFAQQRSARQAATELAVNDSLSKATLLRGQAKAAPVGDLKKWTEALAAAQQAEGILQAGEASESLRNQVAQLVRTLEIEQSEATTRATENEKDRNFLARLDAIRQKFVDAGAVRDEYGDKQKQVEADESYTNAFREFGIDVDQLDPTESGRLLRLRSQIEEFAFSIDFWMLIRKTLANRLSEEGAEDTPRGNADWQRLIAVAKAIDNSLWRNQLRTMAGSSDYPSLLGLADDETELAKQPARSLFLLALILEDSRGEVIHGGDRRFRDQSIRLLKRAWRLSPNDYQICLQLANECPERVDRVRFATAAVAAAPESKIARASLLDAVLPPTHEDYTPAFFRQEEDPFVKQGDEPEVDVSKYLAFKYSNGDVWYIGPIRFDPLTDAKKQEWSLAIDELQEAIRTDPSSVNLRSRLACTLVRLDKYDDAIKECRAIAEIDPQYSSARVIGYTLYGMGQLDRAKALLNESLKKDPESFHQYNLLGTIFYEEGNYRAAFDAFQTEMTDVGEYSYRRKRIWLETTGTFEEVVTAYRKSMELKPHYHGLWEMLAEFLAREGKTEDAIAVYRERIAMYADDDPDYLQETVEETSKLLLTVNRPDEAIELYQTTIAKHPRSILLRKGLARLYGTTGKSAERVAELNQIVMLYLDEMKTNDGHKPAYGLASVYWSLGRDDEARKYYRISIQARQDALGLNSDAMRFATDVREEQRDGELAVEAATRACELTGWGNPMILDTLASAYAEVGDFDAAVKWQLKALELLNTEDDRESYEDNLKLFREKKPVRIDYRN